MITTVLAATAAEPDAGWGKVSALIVAGLVAWGVTSAHQRWTADKKGLPSSPSAPTPSGVNPQVSAGSDPTSDPGRKGGAEGAGDLDVFVSGALTRARTNQVIRAAAARFKVSESTVKRAIRRVRTR